MLLLVFLVFGSLFYGLMFDGRAEVAKALRFHAVTWPFWGGSGVAIVMWLRGEVGSGFATLSAGVVMTALLIQIRRVIRAR